MDAFFRSPSRVVTAGIILRVALLVYGHWQDAHSAIKYTDIDYFVFTDAARYVSHGRSPYLRDTYRYTPLLAWLLVPSTYGNGLWFAYGKALFAVCDVVAGWLICAILRNQYGMRPSDASKFAALWLLNPMVAQISTRGSAEGVLALMCMGLLWAVLKSRWMLAGALLGLAVHFKIYPFVYAPAIAVWIGDGQTRCMWHWATNQARIKVGLTAFASFGLLTGAMYSIYGRPFIDETYLYHLTRTDHRHNFSPYNILLYLNASPVGTSRLHPETLAFVPQLLLSAILIPMQLARKDLASCMLAQTFCFVAFNKVCTSQYFLWYLVFLPFYLPRSTFLASPSTGIVALTLWVLGQAAWLHQAYKLEFKGQSTFVPGLWLSSLAFFAVNSWILGVIISDVRNLPIARVNGRVATANAATAVDATKKTK